MRKRTVLTMLMAGLGLALSACYYAPAPGYAYYDSGYYGGYYGAPAYYGPSYYYGPSVGFTYYNSRWDSRRWR